MSFFCATSAFPDAKIQFSFRLLPRLLPHQEPFGTFYDLGPPGPRLFFAQRPSLSPIRDPRPLTPPWTGTYPFAGVGHLLAFGAVQRVVVVVDAAGVQVDQHGVGVLHGCQGAFGDAVVDGVVDGDHSGVHWGRRTMR